MSHNSYFNEPTGQGDELTPEKGDDTSLEYLDYEEEEDEVEDEVSDVFSVQDVEDNSANPSAQGDETEYFGNSVNACPGRVINTDLSCSPLKSPLAHVGEFLFSYRSGWRSVCT